MPQILSTPGTRYSVHDDLIFTVKDWTKPYDPDTYPDYRYICDVYNDDSLVARLKAYPQPDSKIGVFNISNILRNYCAPTLSPSLNVFKAQQMTTGEFNVSGTCIFGEEYNFTQYLNVSGDTGRKYYGHYNGRKIGTNTNLTAVLGKVASARPLKSKMYKEGKFCFIPFYKDSGDCDVTVTFYNSAGTSIGSGTTALSGNTDYMFSLNFAEQGVQTFAIAFPESAVRMVATIEGVEYDIELICEPKYTNYSVHFLNRYGGWDTHFFTKVSRKSIEIQKSEFGKLPYTISNAGVPEYYNSNKVYNELRSVYASQYKEKLVLNSDNLSDEEYKWLQDLILSPMVYIEMTSGSDVYFVPCVIAASDYEVKKGVNDKVSNLTLQVEFGDQFNTQYR